MLNVLKLEDFLEVLMTMDVQKRPKTKARNICNSDSKRYFVFYIKSAQCESIVNT